MPLSDLRESLDAPVLTLPIGGKAYTVKACTAEIWLRLQEINERTAAAVAAGKKATSDDAGVSEVDLIRMALGDTFETMVKSDVTMAEAKHAGITAYYWQLGQQTVAEALWESAGKATPPESPAAPNKTSTSTSTAAASTTRRRASTSGTSSPKKSAPRRR